MQRGFLIIVFFLTVSLVKATAAPKDSIGVEKKKGKTFVVHKVEPKETLYSLSRKYGVSVNDIRSANVDLKDLKIGQTVLIPSKNTPTNASASNVKSSGPKFKIHKVEPKETLYSISRKYKVNIEDLKKANPGVSDIRIGQSINVPIESKGEVAGKEEKAKEEKSETVKVPEFYTVQPKETFFSISKKFGVRVDEIKKLNPGVSELKIGQRLRLSGSPDNNSDATNIETAEEKEYQEKPDQAKKTETKRTDTPVEKRNYVTVKAPQIITKPESNVPTFSNLKKDGYTKVNETGFAELYQDNSGFHYALHKTAPVGTIIYVINEENGQKVYVRVMGKLSDAGTGVIIKLSPKAYDKVAKGSSKAKVSLTYIP